MKLFEVIFDVEGKEKKLDEIGKLMSDPNFWDSNGENQKILKERTLLLNSIAPWKQEVKELEEMNILLQLIEEQKDEQEAQDLLQKIEKSEETIKQMEFQRMLGGEQDPRNAIVSINAGAGGTEAQDWSEMLLRMYLRWSERRGFQTEIIDILAGEEAGIKNVTFTVNGPYAYGYLKAETGIHRLVRISPYDAGARRHTSFASAFVIPEAPDDIVIAIDEKDLKIDTYRSSGAGGNTSIKRILRSGLPIFPQGSWSHVRTNGPSIRIRRWR